MHMDPYYNDSQHTKAFCQKKSSSSPAQGLVTTNPECLKM
jgi:hypothetical protein